MYTNVFFKGDTFQNHLQFQNINKLMLGGGDDLTQEFDWIDGRYQTNSSLCN